jgi:uncharacterized ferritin-like protein (DUF455 family)
MDSLFERARACILATDPDEKVRLTHEAIADWRDGALEADPDDLYPDPIGQPGRPEKPTLVSPGDVPKRNAGSERGRAALVHALTHIEFNAINLAWDAVYRFRGLPRRFYDDWIKVADDEARHFEMLRERLRAMGREYGDFDAHNGLWDMAEKTAADVKTRMALVPRVLEARSLDVVPGIAEKLREAGDEETARVLDVIAQDEIAHVAAGSLWFRHACAKEELQAEGTFRDLIGRFMKGHVKGPFNRSARIKAGFTDRELAMLNDLAHG